METKTHKNKKKQIEKEVNEILKLLIEDSPCINIQHYPIELNGFRENGEYHHYFDLEFNVYDSGYDIYLDISNSGCYVVLGPDDGEYNKKLEEFILSANGYNYYEGDTDYISDNGDVSCEADSSVMVKIIIEKFNELSNLISLFYS